MTKLEDPDQDRRLELAHFLRTRREKLVPELLGLPKRKRRRTPGLRREEVAELLNISTTWYTWLEQGRAIHVSDEVVENLAGVLQLSTDERVHLFQLTGLPVPPSSSYLPGAIRPVLRDLLVALEPAPAHLRDERWNVLAWNRPESMLVGWDAYPPAERNVLWHFFAHPELRRRMVDWEREARTTLALFRMESGQHLDGPWFSTLLDHLEQASEEFRQWKSLHEVRQTRELPITFQHPEVGLLVLQPVTVAFAYDPHLWMRVLMPLPETDTATKLLRLMSPQQERKERS